ncbi:helix-turn-helix transcriptional regulator [bacterium]|nr:helix-turn-helix transcriptional regulator [bacterium]
MDSSFKQYIKDLENTPEFKAEWRAFGFIDVCVERIDSLGITHAELARRMGVEPPYISQLLSGTYSNMTLLTLQKLADALEFEFEFAYPRMKKEISLSNYQEITVPQFAGDDVGGEAIDFESNCAA